LEAKPLSSCVGLRWGWLATKHIALHSPKAHRLTHIVAASSLWAFIELLAFRVYAQTGNGPPPNPYAKPFPESSFLTSREAFTAGSVLAFGLAMTGIAYRLLTTSKVASEDVIKLFALLVIVTGVLFLVAAGYSAADIAPSMGLLGTIAGYLLGRSTKSAPDVVGQEDAKKAAAIEDDSTALAVEPATKIKVDNL
jgi:hypothetical protein